jgi:hypothetical protein
MLPCPQSPSCPVARLSTAAAGLLLLLAAAARLSAAAVLPADELSLRLNSISQRLMLALQLIPIQKAKATNQRLVRLQMQTQILTVPESSSSSALPPSCMGPVQPDMIAYIIVPLRSLTDMLVAAPWSRLAQCGPVWSSLAHCGSGQLVPARVAKVASGETWS